MNEMIKSKSILIILLSLVLFSCYKEETIEQVIIYDSQYIKISDVFCSFDNKKNTFFWPLATDSIDYFNPFISYKLNYHSLHFKNNEIVNNNENQFGKIRVGDTLELIALDNKNIEDTFLLVFTFLPVIEIFTANEIIDEPKKQCFMRINDPFYKDHGNVVQQFESYAGIEIRGGISQGYPKKSYSVELRYGPESKISNDFPLLGLRDDDDWILDAMYIDKARMRNIVSFEIWDEINKGNEVSDKPTIKGEYIELFINHEYMGVYSLNEKIDQKQLDVQDNLNGFGGYLFKAEEWDIGAVTFQDYTDTNHTEEWAGWIQEYPDPDVYISWDPLYNLVKFVVESSDQEFYEKISSYIDITSFVNYYIMLNLMCGYDNVGKNTFLYKNSVSEPFKIAPWDMDGTWGRNWNAGLVGTSDILSNHLYNRLIELNVNMFRDLLKQRWIDLRSGVLTESNILELFRNRMHLLKKSNSIIRENLKWDLNLDLENEMLYIESWTYNRLNFLDSYYEIL